MESFVSLRFASHHFLLHSTLQCVSLTWSGCQNHAAHEESHEEWPFLMAKSVHPLFRGRRQNGRSLPELAVFVVDRFSLGQGQTVRLLVRESLEEDRQCYYTGIGRHGSRDRTLPKLTTVGLGYGWMSAQKS
jgi:hypothetical protein